MSDQTEGKLIKQMKLLIMLLMAAIVAVVVWWQMNPIEHTDLPSKPSQNVPVETVVAASSEAQVEVEPEVETVISAPELVSVEESDQAEQDSVLQVIEDLPTTTPKIDTQNKLSLAQSDTAVKSDLSEISAKSLSLLANEHILRKFVRAVNALDDGSLVNQYRPFVQPITPFAVEESGVGWSISPQNYARYKPYIDAAEALGAKRLVRLYQDYQPLLEEAFLELGVDKASFDSTLKSALNELISTPETDQSLYLVRPSVMYQYQNKQLEGLSGPQKLMLRIGEQNRKRVKALCRAILDELPD